MTIEFGLLVEKYMGELELSQEDLEIRAGVSQSYISMIVRGGRSVSSQIAMSLARTLEVPASMQAEFLLHAVGYPPVLIAKILPPSQTTPVITR